MMQNNSGLRDVAADGFWRNNPVLVQLLGLCPLLAVTTSLVNGLALGLATAAVLVVTNTVVSMMRRALIPVARIPLYVLIIASLVTCIDLLSNALLDDLHERLGLFIPLIVTNCALLAQADTVATRRPVLEALTSGLATGLGFAAVLTALGGLREIFGHGTLFAGLPLLFGVRVSWLELHLPFSGALVAILPPGAFFAMAALLALRNRLTRERPAPAPAGSVVSTEPAQ
ncbi:MAG TPA: electron transport complex subunit RsxE [Gammaproteobacteria bacterium]|nr:electron transport complex subunit RsxE [Gammaproteobacteria bacterium]